MTVPTVTAPPAALVPGAARPAQDRTGCPSCEHPLGAHDPIGLRFCRATRVGDISRGCVCRST